MSSDRPTSHNNGIRASTEDRSGPTTPPRQANVALLFLKSGMKETPVKQHSIHSLDYRNGDLGSVREAIMKDFDYVIPIIDLNSFLDYLLPPLKRGINVENVISSLKEMGFIVPKDSHFVWKDFTKTPAEQNRKEDEVFAPLEGICKAAVDLAIGTTRAPQTCHLRLMPHVAPKSERGNKTRPDGYFILKKAEAIAQKAKKKENKFRWWRDIALTAELKLLETLIARNKNISQLILSMQQKMSLDPSRRFTFGFTIENTTMRLWFVSRSGAFVSEGFNFTTEINVLTRVFLSFAFATKQELGWDPTILPVEEKGIRQLGKYKIRVDKQWYVTEEVLSDCAADAMVSRGTRVWKVRLLDVKRRKPAEERVLKDYWVEDERELEYTIYHSISRDVEEKYGLETRDRVSRHILKPLSHWIVEVDHREDHTTDVMMRGFTPYSEVGLNLKIESQNNTNPKRSKGPAVASDMENERTEMFIKRHFQFAPKRHYRVIFEEVATTLYAVRKLSDVFTVLKDSAKVFKYIHGSLWVHRDVGVSNLYFCNGRGLIGDLEYAKRKDSQSAHEVRSFLADCMANEAIAGRYNYIDSEEPQDISAMLRFATALRNGEAATNQGSTNPIPFSHNDLHDLESLWWAAIWELIFHYTTGDNVLDKEAKRDRDMQRVQFARQLFPRIHTTEDRLGFFNRTKEFEERLACMPGNLKTIISVLNNIRLMLLSKYKEFEAQLPQVKEDAFSGIHDGIVRLLEFCENGTTGIELIPVATSELRHPMSMETEPQVAVVHPHDNGRVPSTDASKAASVIEKMAGLTLAQDEEYDGFTPMPLPRVRYGLQSLQACDESATYRSSPYGGSIDLSMREGS